MKRKCVYTGENADSKTTVLPKGLETHNWAIEIPRALKNRKRLGDVPLPTELEIEAYETFYALEVAKVKVKYLEARLALVQQEIKKDNENNKLARPDQMKLIEEKLANIEKDLLNKWKEESKTWKEWLK